MRVGILALQGDVAPHAAHLAELGAEPVEVRAPGALADLDGIVLPGGESTTLSLLLDSAGLTEALAAALGDGLGAFGTCAGAILLASTILDGRPHQRPFGALDVVVRRNGYGRQVDSFETDLTLTVDGEAGEPEPPLRAVFIRAPVFESVGADVEVLARHDGRAVLCRQGRVLASTFHPELTGDLRVHRLFLRSLGQRS